MWKPSWGARRPESPAEPLIDVEEETPERRLQWAEQLAETAIEAGQRSRRQARHRDELLRRLLDLIDAHRDAASRAGAVRSGDKRLYRHATRARDELESSAPVGEPNELWVDGDSIETSPADPREPTEARNGDLQALASAGAGNGAGRGASTNGHGRVERPPRWY